ncbi:MAG: hypothetical protein KGI13_08750 [Betaproteobacteria bacterium]|nr:hypothetical protein [Betaproteobacteria bacterium]
MHFKKILIFIIFCIATDVALAKIELLPYGNKYKILISDVITTKDLDDFKSVIDQLEKSKMTFHMNSIQLNSNGGNIDVAMEIGKIIREKNIIHLNRKKILCDSACVFILLGGVSRYPFGKIGIHRATYYMNVIDDNKILKDTNETLTKTKKYIEEMGISSQLYDAIYHTEPWKIYYLTDKEKKDWGVLGDDIYHEEYLIGKFATNRHISHSESLVIFSKLRYLLRHGKTI